MGIFQPVMLVFRGVDIQSHMTRVTSVEAKAFFAFRGSHFTAPKTPGYDAGGFWMSRKYTP